MTTLKNILIPVDYSSCSKNAVQYAVSLAQLLQARLFLLHAYEFPVGAIELSYAGSQDFYQQIEEDAHIEMEVLERNLLYGSGIKYDTICKAGPTIETITKTVNEYNIDLVVMGTQIKTNVEKILFGGNTASTLGKFETPVLAVPEQARFTHLQNIVLAYDFVCFKEKAVITPLLTLAKANNATIHVLHVTDDENEKHQTGMDNGSWISDCLQEVKHTYRFIKSHDVEAAIWQYTKEENVDLLSLNPRKSRSLLERLFYKSLTRSMVYHPHLPLFILQ